ncbi:MAG: tRNA (adenosine(37)-N6)-threonylcarbamoyltransferase complex transferase subunit TsaD, partial [bacterium]
DHPLGSGPDADVNNLAASYQEAIVDTLVQRASHASETARVMAVVGGVSLNRRLREKLADMAEKRRLKLVLADPRYCTDNAAMIAGLAFHKWNARLPLDESLNMDVDPNMGIGE